MQLTITPDLVYVDGKFLPKIEVNCKAVIGGDKLISEISAASIIAKVHRDDFMKKLDKQYPIYDFAKNKRLWHCTSLKCFERIWLYLLAPKVIQRCRCLMMQASFVHLRVSSEFSISRGLLRINEIIENAQKLKMPAVALTDLNNMFGMVKFFKKAEAVALNPLQGLP